jgi:2-amino-4-hydroxy-6-hydroxymethyldihydropteridine diphosphokinase
MATIFLSTGTNLGDREGHLRKANEQISNRIGRIERISGVYETAAWGGATTLAFLNQVLKVETNLEPQEVLQECLAIEHEMGRVRKERWGERNIDIDLLFYENAIIEQPQLIVPHPRLHERNFVLLPLHEICPNWKHPILNKNIAELMADCSDSLAAKIIAKP